MSRCVPEIYFWAEARQEEAFCRQLPASGAFPTPGYLLFKQTLCRSNTSLLKRGKGWF